MHTVMQCDMFLMSARYLDALFHTIDGNFQHMQKMKPMDMNDMPLTTGAAYYANERDYTTFQKGCPQGKKEVGYPTSLMNSTDWHVGHIVSHVRCGGLLTPCRSGHRHHQGDLCETHVRTSTRHRGHGSGRSVSPLHPVGIEFSLTLLASYVFADYVHLSALWRYLSLLLHIAGYDINCQYRINFEAWIKEICEKFAGLDSIPQKPFPPTICTVGKFHLPAHTASCYRKHRRCQVREQLRFDGP